MVNLINIYTNMATLQKKKTNGINYWYIVESVRVNGKPRPKVIAYLGKPDDILQKLNGKTPLSTKSYEYGTVAVCKNIIDKLNIENLFNKIVFDNNKVPVRNNLNFGQTMALIIMQRALHPGSKRSFSEWSKKTVLPQIYNFDYKKITSQHFWDMMDYAKEEHIKKIEFEITKAIIEKFNIKLDLLFYDYTNFFTFIDSDNKENKIARRGKNKQKRNDLRQFCLALLVVRHLKIPLFSDIYEGNKNDVTEFNDSIDKIKNRLTDLAQEIETITLVFDKGNNSKENFNKLENINYVASFSIYHEKELREIPYSKFYKLKKSTSEGEEILLCYRAKKNIWDKEQTVVMYKSEALFNGQLIGLKKDIEKTKKELIKLQESGKSGYYIRNNKRKAWTYELFEQEIEQTINKQFVRDIIEFKINRSRNNCFRLDFTLNKNKYNYLKKTTLGKRILITSRHSWKDEEIIEAYHGQGDVENAFKQIKNPFHNCVRPQYHWTDQKIIVHTFCSILSLTISMLIEKIAREKEFNMSINEIYERLQDIRKVKYIYQEKKNKKTGYNIEYKLEEVEDDVNTQLFELLSE